MGRRSCESHLGFLRTFQVKRGITRLSNHHVGYDGPDTNGEQQIKRFQVL